MGKLADLIQQATRPKAAKLGFATERSKPAPTMITVAVISKGGKDTVSEAISSGAAAVLLTSQPSADDIKAAVETAGDVPVGVAANASQLDGLSDTGLDFIVLDNDAPASALQNEGLTFLLKTDEELSDVHLRTIDTLPIAALYLDAPGAQLTIGRQMELQRITGLARKPMLISPAPDSDREGLLSLRDSGAMLLAVDMSASDGSKTLAALRDLIDGLPSRRDRQRGDKAEVTLPTASHRHEEPDEDDEE